MHRKTERACPSTQKQNPYNNNNNNENKYRQRENPQTNAALKYAHDRRREVTVAAQIGDGDAKGEEEACPSRVAEMKLKSGRVQIR